MDYEKKYKEALELARDYYKANLKLYKADENVILEDIFPELAESEDEKTRKRIIALVNTHGQGMYKGDMLAWLENIPYTIDHEKREGFHLGYKAALEKQGEKQQKTPIWKHWKDGIAGNGEGKPIYLIKYGHTYSLSSCLCFECDYIKLSELDKLMLEKQGEQNPAWSEKDEKMIGRIRSIIEAYAFSQSAVDVNGDLCEKEYIDADNWLKSLKQRIGGKL